MSGDLIPGIVLRACLSPDSEHPIPLAMTIDSHPFTLALEEKTSHGFIRILREISSLAGKNVRKSPTGRTEATHALRVLIKRLRALLWFARPILTDKARKEARTRLRVAACLLAEPRDISVLRKTLEILRAEAVKTNGRAAINHAARQLAHNPDASSEKELQRQWKRAADLIQETILEIVMRAGAKTEWPSPVGRLKKAIKGAQHAGTKARESANDADFHNWRKKAKRLMYIAEFTANQNQGLTVPQSELDELQSNLGYDHDCVMVEDRLTSVSLDRTPRRRVRKLLHRRKAHLRKKARKIARQIEL